MGKIERYDVLVRLTNNAALIWKQARGIAPDSVADKLDEAMLEWPRVYAVQQEYKSDYSAGK